MTRCLLIVCIIGCGVDAMPFGSARQSNPTTDGSRRGDTSTGGATGGDTSTGGAMGGDTSAGSSTGGDTSTGGVVSTGGATGGDTSTGGAPVPTCIDITSAVPLRLGPSCPFGAALCGCTLNGAPWRGCLVGAMYACCARDGNDTCGNYCPCK